MVVGCCWLESSLNKTHPHRANSHLDLSDLFLDLFLSTSRQVLRATRPIEISGSSVVCMEFRTFQPRGMEVAAMGEPNGLSTYWRYRKERYIYHLVCFGIAVEILWGCYFWGRKIARTCELCGLKTQEKIKQTNALAPLVSKMFPCRPRCSMLDEIAKA